MRVRLLIVLLLTGVLVAPAPSTAPAASTECPDADLVPSAEALPRARTAVLCLLNEERSSRGRQPLRADRSLRAAASGYARLMVDFGFFDHTSPRGSTMVSRVRATPYLQSTSSWSLGENLAWGAGRMATPAATVQAWMESPGHRANILDARFRDVGVGVALGAPEELVGSSRAATYVTEFGRRSRT